MAVAFVANIGSVSQGGGGATTLTITVPAAGVALNHQIVVRLVIGSATALTSVTDTGGNSYAVKVGPTDNSVRCWILMANAATALVSGNTIVASFPAKITGVMVADEFSGATTTADGTNSGTGSSTTPSSGAITPAGATDLIVGLVGGPSSMGTYTEDSDNAGGDTWHSLTITGVQRGAAYKITTSAVSQTYNPTYTTSNAWADQIAAFLAASAAFIAPPAEVWLQAVNRAGTF